MSEENKLISTIVLRFLSVQTTAEAAKRLEQEAKDDNERKTKEDEFRKMMESLKVSDGDYQVRILDCFTISVRNVS
jgi:hypothetical protein